MFLLALLVYWKGIGLRAEMRQDSVGYQKINKVKMFLYELSLIIDTSTKSLVMKTQSQN